MKKELEQRWKNAVEIMNAGDFDQARRLMLEMSKEDPESPTIAAILGLVCKESQRLDEAEEHFRRACKLRPDSEPLSLGLYHCLWGMDRTDEALDEMKRFFFANGLGEGYTKLLKDMNA